MKVSVVIPIYNEQENIVPFYNRILKVIEIDSINDYEIIYVNDGSIDDSLKLIVSLSRENEKIKYINFSRNFGHQLAITAGIDLTSGDYIVIMDGDGQDPPELIPELISVAKRGNDVVYAKRTERLGETWFKKFTAKYYYRVLNKLTDVDIPMDTGDFRLISKRVKDVLKKMPEKHKYLRGQIAWMGFSSHYVEFVREVRMSGETKFSLLKMLKFGLDGIVGFSTSPLRFAMIMGFFVSISSICLVFWAIYQYAVGSVIVGWTSLQVTILFLGGVQLIAIGIIGEYLGRLSDNVKNRPSYIIKDTNIKDFDFSE